MGNIFQLSLVSYLRQYPCTIIIFHRYRHTSTIATCSTELQEYHYGALFTTKGPTMHKFTDHTLLYCYNTMPLIITDKPSAIHGLSTLAIHFNNSTLTPYFS